jgi:hypothetical protein
MKGADGLYIFISDTAKKLYKFNSGNFKVDGTTLLRDTVLTEEIYQSIKSEVLKKAIQGKTAPGNYSPDDFTNAWHNYLTNKFKGYEFRIDEGIIKARDFPIKNVDYSNRYGFAAFIISLNPQYLWNIKKSREIELHTKFRNYRLFWSPTDRINIYGASNLNFQTISEKVAYCAEGLEMMIQEINKFS